MPFEMQDHESALRNLSKQVFGQELRLIILLCIKRHPHPRFNQTQLLTNIGSVRASALQRPLASLEGAGFISRLASSDRNVWFEKQPSLIWDLAEELHRKVAETQQPSLFG